MRIALRIINSCSLCLCVAYYKAVANRRRLLLEQLRGTALGLTRIFEMLSEANMAIADVLPIVEATCMQSASIYVFIKAGGNYR
jgi:hypothetical protein